MFKTQFYLLVLLSIFRNYECNVIKGNNPTQSSWPTLTGEPTQINAHRGETVLAPENTLASTALAAIQESDHIEFDLSLTKDGILVLYHDLTLRSMSNVATLPQFADKMRNFTGIVDEGRGNQTITNNWFIDDFTLAELRDIRVRQRGVGIRPKLFDDLLPIPTVEEFLTEVHHLAHGLNRSVGLVLELKHPMFHNTFHNQTPRYMEERIVTVLERFGYPISPDHFPNCRSDLDGGALVECGHLVLQSFELTSVEYLYQRAPFIEMSMLVDARHLPLLTFQGMLDLSSWITYFSPWKELLYTGILAQIEKDNIEYDEQLIDDMGGFVPPNEIVPLLHSLGVKVFIYTIYDSRENSRRGCTIQCDPQNKEVEMFFYFDMGVDGMFAENMMENREIRAKYQYERLNGTSNEK